jgi:hypothetical protein
MERRGRERRGERVEKVEVRAKREKELPACYKKTNCSD